MAKQILDLSLIYVSSFISDEIKETFIEDLLREFNIKFEKYYSSSNDRTVKSDHGKYIDKKYKITVYEFNCGDSIYGFLIFLLNKRLKQIDKLNKSWY